MHNTVIIDGRSQSEPSGPFHWRTRADAACTAWETLPGRDRVAGRLTAYAPVIHDREITAVHGAGWLVVDRFSGAGHVQAAALWHIHPDWRLEALGGCTAILRHLDGSQAVIHASAPLARATANGLDEYSPAYGRIEKATCLECNVAGVIPIVLITVVPADGLVETARQLASSVQR